MIKIHLNHIQSNQAGYGVAGQALLRAINSCDEMKVVRYNGKWVDGKKSKVDVYFSFGTPEVIEERQRFHGSNTFHVHYALWESTKLSDWYAQSLRDVDVIVVSCGYLVDLMRYYGFNNVVKIHLPVDSRFAYKPRVDDGIFTFYHYNGYEFRKGTEWLIKAFIEEFGTNEPVKLVIKARDREYGQWMVPECKVWNKDRLELKRQGRWDLLERVEHPLIEEIIGRVSDEEMVRLSDKADCFVFPSKGEGWGLTPLEMMQCGIVPIVPLHSSFSEWFSPEYMISVDSTCGLEAQGRYPGFLWKVSVEDLKRKMRWAYMNEKKLRSMGKVGSEIVSMKFNEHRIGCDILNLLLSRNVKGS